MGGSVHVHAIHGKSTEKLNMKYITPKDIASIVTQALGLGWTPDVKGSALVFDLVEENIIPRGIDHND